MEQFENPSDPHRVEKILPTANTVESWYTSTSLATASAGHSWALPVRVRGCHTKQVDLGVLTIVDEDLARLVEDA